MNETTLTAAGTLMTPVQLRHLPDGTPVTSFRIACHERRKDRETGNWTDHDTLFASVTCWRRLAENVCASFRSGDPILVRGRIYSRSYEKDGRRSWVTEIDADAIGPDLTRSTALITRTGRSGPDGAAGQDRSAVQDAAPASTGSWSSGSDSASGDREEGGAPSGERESVAVAGR
ncbi:single-stranded DNA-binding protein [Pseudonocardia sp.]|uniref:single-stranded DNA-binding protein n=1 Tax=Pseudonocardia sp. TaxID=60912 RepID=UPI002620419C|nr:single-stranded DNA-binding protein [Pseudonocardia sp.]